MITMANISNSVGTLISPTIMAGAYLKINTLRSNKTGMAKAAFLMIVFAVIND